MAFCGASYLDSFSCNSFKFWFFNDGQIYVKEKKKRGGPSKKTKWAWKIIEFPSPALILLFFLFSPDKNIPLLIFVIVWLSHYLHRTFYYPFSQSGRNKPYPLVIVLMALVFNRLNGFVNGD